uniref:FERM domain-containing protein n=1 Tax=Rhabditophanes sp. KR3021 TaxID=114890 RepID=A0AC35UAU6_9BILA
MTEVGDTRDQNQSTVEDSFVQAGVVNGKQLQAATVHFLDATNQTFFIHKNAEGEVLINLVAKYLQLHERDYFGLTFHSQDGNRHWLYNDRKIIKKLKGASWDFYFEVRFYMQEPSQLVDDLTKYLVYLQVRNDIHSKRLPVTFATQALLASFVIQDVEGDFKETLDYEKALLQAKVSDVISSEFASKVKELHKQHKGLNNIEAEVAYLNVAKSLNMYGMFKFQAKDHLNQAVVIGISAPGISIYHDQADKNETNFSYKLSNYATAKELWKIGVEHHTFFRLIQPEDDLKRGNMCAPRGNRTFRYYGRTQYQTKLHATMFGQMSPDFERSGHIRVDPEELIVSSLETTTPVKNVVDVQSHPHEKTYHIVEGEDVSIDEDDRNKTLIQTDQGLASSKSSHGAEYLIQDSHFSHDTFTSSGYATGDNTFSNTPRSDPSTSRIRFADRVSIDLEKKKKIRRTLFGKGKEKEYMSHGSKLLGYPTDDETQVETNVLLTQNYEFQHLPIDREVALYHPGQSTGKGGITCCGPAKKNGKRNAKGKLIYKSEISKPLSIEEDLEKYPLRYKSDPYHSGVSSESYFVNKKHRKFKRLQHEGTNEVIKKEKVDFKYYPALQPEAVVDNRLEKIYELEKPFDGQLDECSRTNDMGNTPLNVVCESYPVPKYKAANRKQKSGVLSCLKSKTPIEERKQEEYGIQEETIESDPHHIVKRVLRDEDYPVQEPDQVQAYISHDQFDPSIPGTSDQYLVQESVEERTASPVKNYIEVKGRKGKKSSPSKESYDFNKDKYEGPLEDVEKSYDLFTLPLNDHVDTYDYPKYSPMKKNKKTTITNEYSNNYGYSTDKYDGPLENTQRTNDINDTSLADYVEHFEVPKYSPAKPKEKSPVKSDPNQKYNLSSERYEGPLEAIEKYFDMESNPINEHVESYEIPKYIPLKINTKKDIMKERTPSPAEGEDINYPSATVVTAAEIVVKSKKQKKSKKSEVSGNYNVMEQNEIDESSLTTDNLPKYEKIIINHPDEDRVIVKEDIVITQSTEEEKPSTSFVKEVTIVEPEVVKKDSINEADIRKEKSNSLSRLLGRFNRSGRRDSNHDDIVDVKKKSGTLLSDRDSGVEDPGTDAGTLPRLNEEQNELSEKKTKKQKKASLLCSSTGKKGSMAYLPIEQDTDNKVLKNYPTAEAPYEGEVLNIGRDSDLPTNDLRQNVEVYHSGNSVKQPSWNRAFAIFTRTKHDGIEDVINKENINKELYELDTTQYDGPFEVMNVQTQLETSPIQTYSKVYHSGQSFQKKGKKSSSKRQTLNAADSEEDEYHPTSKEKYSSLSRFMGLFNRPKKTETHVFSEGDSGLDGSNSSAEVPANYSISNKKVKKSKYDLDPQPFTGTYENTVKINELRTAPLTESVDIQASGSLQKTGTLDTSYDASIGSESDEEKKNTRSNTLSKFIQRFHLQKKSNGGSDNLKSFEKYPPMTESFEGNLETVELTKTMPTTPLDTSVTLYDVPKYQAKIEKPPGCLSCAVPTRKESVHMYEVKEVTEEDPRITYHHKTSIESERILYGSAAMSTDSEGSEMEETPVEEPTVNEKPFGLKLTVQRPVIPQIDEMAVVTPATDMTFEFKNKKKSSKLACLSSSSSTTSKSSASVEEIRPIGKDEINFEFYPTYDSYKGPVEQTHQNIDFETVPIREHVQLYKVKKYRARKEGDGNHMFACFGKPKLSGSARRHKKSETKSTNYSLGFERSVLVELPVANARLSVNEDENIIKEVQYEAAQPEVKIETAQLEAEIKTKKSGPSCLACVRPKAKKLDVAYESPSSVHIEHGKPKIEKDLEAAEKDLLLKTKKSGPSCFSCVSPKSKKAKLEINQEVPEVAISSDEIEQPTLHGDLELALPEKDAEVKAKKPRVASCFTCIRPQAKLEKRAYKLKQYPISATYEGPVVELKQEPLVGRANLEEHVQLYDIPKYNIKSPKCAALNCASKPKKVDLEAEVEYKPIQVSSAEIDVVKSDEAIELDVEAPKKDLDVEIKAKKASPSSCFSCITPKSKKAKLDVTTPEYVIPSAQVDIDTAIEQPAVQADLQVQPHDVDVEIKTKKMDIESPSTRVDIEQGTDHIDLEIVKPDRKLDFELEGEKPRGLLFSCMKSKPKKIDLEAEYKVEEVPAAQVEINMDKAELQEQLKESVPRGKLEGDAKIKKPRVVSCFTCIRPQAKLEKRAYKLKQYPISATYEGPVVELKQEPLVGRANLEEHVQLYDIPKYNIKSSKCAALNCASKPKKVELEAEYKPAELPTAEIKLEGPDSEIKLENPEDEIKIEVPQKEIDLKIKKEKSSSPSCFACIRPKSKKAKLDVDYKAPEVGVDEIRVEQPELHADIEASIPQKEIELEVKAKKSSPSCFTCVKPKSKKAKFDVEYKAPEIGVDEIRVEQPELHADIEASIPQKEIDLKIKKEKSSSPSCFACVKPKSKKAKLDVEYRAPEVGVDEIRVEQPELHADIEASIPQKEVDIRGKKSRPSCFACVKPKSKKAKLEVGYKEPEVVVPTSQMEINIQEPSIEVQSDLDLPEQKVEAKIKTKKPHAASCFACNRRQNKKMDVNSYPISGIYEGPVVQLKQEPLVAISNLDEHVELYDIPKYNVKSPKCISLNCGASKQKKIEMDTEYEPVDIEVPSTEIPEINKQVEIKVSQDNLGYKHKTSPAKASCFSCASGKKDFGTEYKKPEMILSSVEIEMPESEIRLPSVDIEMPKIELPSTDIETPKVELPSADIELPSAQIDFNPSLDVNVHAMAPKLSHDYELSFERPEGSLDAEIAETKSFSIPSVSPKTGKFEFEYKKAEIEIPKVDIPQFEVKPFDLEVQSPRIQLNKEFHVTSPEAEIAFERPATPEFNIDTEVKGKKLSVSCLSCVKSNQMDLTTEYKGTGVTLPDDDQAIEVKLATLDAAVAEKDVDVVAKAKKPKAASCLACVKPKVSKKPLVLEAYPSTEVYEGNVVGLEKEGVIPTINLKEEVELYPIPKYNLKSPKCGLFSCAAKPKKVVVDDQYTPRDLTVDQPQIEVDVSVPKKKLDVQVKTKKPSLSSRFAPKSKKVELETKLDVPADEVDVAIQQPEMHSQIEVIAPNEKLEADIKVKKPSSKCLSCVGGPKAKKERRAYQMSQYPINATYDSPVLELKQESLVPRSNLDEHVQLYDIPEYNIKSPKCASLNCASKTKKVELESEYKPVEADNPEIEVAVPEIEVTKPEIEVEVPKNKLDVEGKTKRSRSSCFSCFASPKPKKANIEVEYKAPEVAPAEIEIEEPKIHADLEVAISEKELEVKTKKSSPSCFACVRKPKSKKDKLEVEYKGPEVAPTEIEIEEPKIHADLEVTPPEKELEIKAKKSPSCFACVRKPKSKKDKLEVEYKGPEVVIPSTEVDINEPEIHADLEVTPPEKELEIKAKKSPSCFACVRKPKSKKDKLEVEYKAPEVVIPSTEVDINEPEIHADLEVTPPEKELEIKAKKSPSCFACVRKPKSKRDKFEGATVSIDHADADLEIKEPQLDASKGISCCVSPKSKKIDLDAQYHVSDLTLTTPQIKATELPTPKIKVHLPSSEFKSDASLDITSPEVHFERPDFKIEEIHKTAGYDVNYSTPKIETFDISINNDFESSYKNSDPSLNVETGSLLLRGQDIDIGKQIYKEVEIRMNTPEIKISVDEVDTPSRMSLDHSAQIHGETLQIETPHSQIDANLKTKSGGCFNCASKPKKVKHSKTNLEPYLTSDVYKGQLESVTRKDTLQTEPLSSYITLYNVPKYRPANKQPKCAKFNCLGKKQNLQIEEYTPVDKTIVANRQIGVDSLATSDNVVSAEIEPISINVDGKKISNRPSSTCGSLSCASPKQKGEVYYPNEKLDFSKYPNVETYEGEVSFLNAQTDIADQPISLYVTVYDIPKYKAANKQKGCASLNCTTTKPSGDYELTPTQIEHQIENDIETAYAVDFKEAKPTITPESTPIVTPIRDLELVGTQESSWSRFVIPEHTPDYERQGEIELKPESYLANQQAEFSFAVDEVRESPSRHQVSMNTIALDHSIEFDRSLQSSNFEKELDSTNLEKELDIIDGEKHFDASKFGSELEYSVHVEKDVSDGVSFENELPDIPVIIQSHNSEYKRKHDEMRKQSVEIAHQVEEKFHVHVDPFEEKPIIEQINDGQSPIVLPPPPPKSDKIPLITAFKCFSCIKGSAKIQRDSKNLYYTAHYPLLQETHSSELLCMNKTPDADYDSLEKSVLLQTYPKYTAKKIVASDSDDKSDSSGHDKGNKKSSKISFKFGRKRHSGASETVSYKDVNLDEYKLTSALYEGELESVKREDEIKTLPIKEYANPIHKGYYKNLRKQKTKSLPTSDSGISEGESISSGDSPDARNLQKTCAPFTACMPSKHKKLDSPYRKVETGKPQPFGYSTEKYTGELEALDMHKELGSQELVSAVDVYHNGDSYDKLDKKTSSQFHLIPFCVSKQQPSTPPTVRVTTCTLSSSLNKNDQLGLLEFQRISDGSHTQTSLFSTVDPSGDLQCQLDVTRAQKMDCECRVVVCQSGLNDCDRFCKFPRSYQSVTTTITMNKNGGPSSANSTKSPSASFFSMIKKPFTNNQSSKNNQTTKKSKKTASDKAGKNTPSPHSKSSDSDAVEVYDTKAGLNDKSKNSATNYSLETPILSNNMVVNHSNINPQQQSSNQDNAPVTLTQRDPVHEGQTNLRSSVIMDSTVLPLDQNSSGPYKEAEPSDYALIRENKIETVFKLRGNTGQAPDFSSDSPDMVNI